MVNHIKTIIKILQAERRDGFEVFVLGCVVLWALLAFAYEIWK